MVKYVIYDEPNEGYAHHDALEGWIFTRVLIHAKLFDTLTEAEYVIDRYYTDVVGLIIEPYELPDNATYV